MKKLLLSTFMVGVFLILFSCKKTEPVNSGITSEQPATSNQTFRYVIIPNADDNGPILSRTGPNDCTPIEVTLFAGQTINSGTVTVSNDGTYIYVTYTTTNGWVLAQTHLYVGDCALIPVNNPGNPIPGQFPYTATHNNVTTYTYQIPISRIPQGSCGCIAAHAVVKQYNSSNQLINQQTGWGNGTLINLNGGNWGMKFDYCSCIPL